MKPKTSIIIPTYNEEKYIGKTPRSIRNQKFNSYEIIVGDSRSEDRTRKSTVQYADKIVLTKAEQRPREGNQSMWLT